MQYRSSAPGRGCRASRSPPVTVPVRSVATSPRYPDQGRLAAGGSNPHTRRSSGVEYLIRAARITDIDRVVALSDGQVRTGGGQSPLGSADLLRQLVYLPQASIFVAEARREVVGG